MTKIALAAVLASLALSACGSSQKPRSEAFGEPFQTCALREYGRAATVTAQLARVQRCVREEEGR